MLDRDGTVVFDVGNGEREVAVLADFLESDDQSIADVVLLVQFGFVNQSGELVRDVDEDAVVNNTVDDGVISRTNLRVLERTVGCQVVDDRAGTLAGVAGGRVSHGWR